MMKSRKTIGIVVVLLSALVFGFIQEYIKINLNYVIDMGSQIPGFFEMDIEKKMAWIEYVKQHSTQDFYNTPNNITWFYELELSTLNKLKWVLTLVFVLVYFAFNTILIYWISGENQLVRWMIALYIAAFAFALLLYLSGKLVGSVQQVYPVSRKVVGALQSLVPLMILVPAFWLSRQWNNKTLEK
jgi:hypothetical protein